MENTRILKGYSKEERKELEEAKDNGFFSVIALICSIDREDDDCRALYEKYYREDTNSNNQMAKDIIDYYAGVAKFPDKKYYVHLIKNDCYSYINIDTDGEVKLDSRLELNGWKTKFTRDEVVAIDPRFVTFMEKIKLT